MSTFVLKRSTNERVSRFLQMGAHALWIMALTFSVTGNGMVSVESAFCVTSMAAMRSLISQEAKLISHLGKVLDIAAARENVDESRVHELRRHLDCIYQSHEAVKDSGPKVNRPITGFRLIRRLLRDWGHVTNSNQSDQLYGRENPLQANLKSMQEVISQWRLWPKESDEEGAALALIRIGHTYQLYPSTQEAASGLDSIIWQSHVIPSSFKEVFHDDWVPSLSGRSDSSTLKHSTVSKSRSSCASSEHSEEGRNANPTKTGDHLRSTLPCVEHQHGLSIDDIVYVIEVAISHGYLPEAKKWFSLISNFLNNTIEKPREIQTELEALRERLKSSRDVSPQSGLASNDAVRENYVRLCRRSIEPSDKKPFRSSFQCGWKNVWPYQRYKMEILHKSPDVYRFHDVISNREIEHIKSQAEGRLFPSTLDNTVPNEKIILGWRSSHTAWLGDKTAVLQTISMRVGQVCNLLTSNCQGDETAAEPYQVVNYGLGGMYGPHLDTLYTLRRNGTGHRANSSRPQGDRLATWMFYLSDVKLGGATVFPLLDLDIKPIKGSAVLWYNLHRNGQPDPHMVHAGCPVVEGDKWIANKWIRETAQWKKRPCHLKPWL